MKALAFSLQKNSQKLINSAEPQGRITGMRKEIRNEGEEEGREIKHSNNKKDEK